MRVSRRVRPVGQRRVGVEGQRQLAELHGLARALRHRGNDARCRRSHSRRTPPPPRPPAAAARAVPRARPPCGRTRAGRSARRWRVVFDDLQGQQLRWVPDRAVGQGRREVIQPRVGDPPRAGESHARARRPDLQRGRTRRAFAEDQPGLTHGPVEGQGPRDGRAFLHVGVEALHPPRRMPGVRGRRDEQPATRDPRPRWQGGRRNRLAGAGGMDDGREMNKFRRVRLPPDNRASECEQGRREANGSRAHKATGRHSKCSRPGFDGGSWRER